MGKVAVVRSRGLRVAVLLAAAGAPLAPALAYWELIPQVEAGATYENNPRYITDEAKDEPGFNAESTRDALGTYTDVRLEGNYRTPTTQASLIPRFRATDYLKSNKDLNDDDFYLDFRSAHSGTLGNVGLDASYQETGLRTSEFESATPDNPDDPPPISSGSGRFSDNSQETLTLQPSLNYQLSQRNILGVTGLFSDTTYDEDETSPINRNYLDYEYSSVEVSARHVLDARNYLVMALNGGNFLAEEDDSSYRNSTDSFGITAAYNRTFSETLTGSITAGMTRSSININNVFRNQERNFVGSLDLRKRSELTTANFTLSSQIAPRSDGTEVVQERVRLLFERRLTNRLSGNISGLYSRESAVGRDSTSAILRQDRDYFTVDTGLSWSLTETLSVYGSYTYVSDTTDVIGGNVHQTNNRLYFGVRYRGVGLRR